jgi:2-dehydropantoate 2-reductase
MRVLVLGAGATGGYYGARLAEAGCDVTFLVRPARAEKLSRTGLILRSPVGDAHIPSPQIITKATEAFDLIILSCKAYDLDQSIATIKPAVGEKSMIIPILNGLKHLEALNQHLGAEHVLGGTCYISSTLDFDGAIIEFSKTQTFMFGERNGGSSKRCEEIAELMSQAKFTAKLSDNIMLDMWQKFVANTTVAGITCLMRNNVGNIISAPGGKELVTRLFNECAMVAESYGFSPRPEFKENHLKMLTSDPNSELKASMLRDIERGAATEGDHVLGDMVARAEKNGIDVPTVRAAYCNVKAYDIARSKSLKVPAGVH